MKSFVGFFACMFVYFLVVSPTFAAEKYVDAFDRVMKTGTIRCGYIQWAPLLSRDLKTGELSGIYVDYLNALGRDLGLKIEWTEEATVENWPLGLEAGRYDVFCVGVSPVSSRARLVDFTTPINYYPMYLYARADESRFDSKYERVNNSAVKIVGFDGTSQLKLAEDSFPEADVLSIPLMANQSDAFLHVVGGKSDLTVSDAAGAELFRKNNPGKLRRVEGPPINVYAGTMAVRIGEDRLRRMIDNATYDFINRGLIERILLRYESPDTPYLRVAPSYIEKQK
jgi:polar amino acid transport system substrate-binding protein